MNTSTSYNVNLGLPVSSPVIKKHISRLPIRLEFFTWFGQRHA